MTSHPMDNDNKHLHSTASDEISRVWNLMEKLDFCMLVSNSDHQFLSRPMSSICKSDEGLIYFLSNATAEQLSAINRNSRVLLNYSDASKTFIALTGDATMSKDRALIKRLWNAGAQAFWPEGPEASDVAVIAVSPQSAEYWDGDMTLVAAAKMVFALTTGSTPDMGDNSKVQMS